MVNQVSPLTEHTLQTIENVIYPPSRPAQKPGHKDCPRCGKEKPWCDYKPLARPRKVIGESANQDENNLIVAGLSVLCRTCQRNYAGSHNAARQAKADEEKAKRATSLSWDEIIHQLEVGYVAATGVELTLDPCSPLKTS
jgi:hypothetical protein